MAGLILLGFLALVFLILVIKTLYTVRTYTAGVVERFGKFNRIVRPGLHVLLPFAESVYFVDLQVKQAQFQVETKTKRQRVRADSGERAVPDSAGQDL